MGIDTSNALIPFSYRAIKRICVKNNIYCLI